MLEKLEKSRAAPNNECPLCMEDFDEQHCVKFALECGHVFCRACLSTYVAMQAEEGAVFQIEQGHLEEQRAGQVFELTRRVRFGFRCPAFRCSALVCGDAVARIGGASTLRQFASALQQVEERRAQMRTNAAHNDDEHAQLMSVCPRCNGDDTLVLRNRRHPNRVRCSLCFAAVCLACFSDHPARLTCGEAQLLGPTGWPARFGRRQSAKEGVHGRKVLIRLPQSTDWMANLRALDLAAAQFIASDQNMRACPHCQSIIEKNGGCNQMWCVFCRGAFTWPEATKVDASTMVAILRRQIQFTRHGIKAISHTRKIVST